MAYAREDLKVNELQHSKKGLTTIEDLGKYPNLQKADFSKNRLVDANGLRKCTKLRHLNLSQNQLVLLDFAIKLKNLNVFNAGNNKVSCLDPLEGLNEVKALILNNNSISQILPIQRLTSITTLILSNNRIEEVDVRALSSLSKLQLSHNKIHTFPNIKFNGELKNLLLNDNLIKEVPAACVETSRLDILDLGKNKIKTFKSIRTLQHITRLQQLSLRGNALCEVNQYEDKVLSLLPSLRTFDNSPVQKDGKIQHRKSALSVESECANVSRKRAREAEGEDYTESQCDSTEQITETGQQAHSTNLLEESDKQSNPRKKKIKLKPQTASTSSLKSFKESLLKLQNSQKAPRKGSEGVDALKEVTSGVVRIHEIKNKKSGKQRKGETSQDIFSAFQTDVGSGSASCW